MKLLIATPLLRGEPGGPGQYAYELTRACVSAGCAVDVLPFSHVRHLLPIVRHFVLFVRALQKIWSVDYVIVLDSFSVALPVVLAAVLLRKKVAVRIGGDFVWEHYIERTHDLVLLSEFYTVPRALSVKERLVVLVQKFVVVRLASFVIFSTEWQRTLWQTPYKLSRMRTYVIENAYTPPPQLHVMTGAHSRVIWCGRDIVLKNVVLLEKAIEMVRKKYPECEYQRYTNVSHEEVITALKKGGVLIIPSISEVSPNLVCEAFSVGTPVVLTTDCGLHHVLDGAVEWVNPKDVEDIAQKLSKAMTEEGYGDMCRKMHSFTHERTYDDITQDFLTLTEHA